MLKRLVTSLLWLFAVWTFGDGLSMFTGIPSLVGPILGLAIAGLVWWDPAGWLWDPRPSRAARRRIADLARVAPAESATAILRERESAQG